MARFLCGYMGMPEPAAEWKVIKSFICPGFQAYGPIKWPITNSMVFTFNGPGDPTNVDNPVPFRIFGDFSPVEAPHIISEIMSYGPLNNLPVTGDLDQQSSATAQFNVNEVPLLPVHGKFRNWLFLDGHVATRKPGVNGRF